MHRLRQQCGDRFDCTARTRPPDQIQLDARQWVENRQDRDAGGQRRRDGFREHVKSTGIQVAEVPQTGPVIPGTAFAPYIRAQSLNGLGMRTNPDQ
jgi:hypothetical protein